MNPLCHSCETQYPDMCDDCIMVLDPELDYSLMDAADFEELPMRVAEATCAKINISSGEDVFV